MSHMSDMDAVLFFGIGLIIVWILFCLGIPFLALLMFFEWQTAALITAAIAILYFVFLT